MRELMLDNGQWLRGPLLVGLVLGLIGPFGTYDLLPLSVRLVYWTAIITLNWALCDIAARWLDQLLPRDMGGRSTAVILVTAVVVSGPATGLVTIANGVSSIGWPDRVLLLYGQVFLLTTAISFPVFLIASESESSGHLRSASMNIGSADGSLFQMRLANLKVSEIRYIETQDHYLCLHSDHGSELILCRMEDASRELSGLGHRVHRCWWVSDKARSGIERVGQSIHVVLNDGHRVPIGRTYRAALSKAGWL